MIVAAKEAKPADLYAAHVFARLFQARPVTARECAAVMDPAARAAASAMLGVGQSARPDVFWESLGEHAAWWVDLANSVDLAAPAEDEGAWQTPSSPAVARPESFPAGVFPAALSTYVEEIAHVMCCAVDYPAAALLALAGGALGRAAVVQPKASWREPASLFMALVGDPGSTKSPAMDMVCAPAWRIQAEALEAHKLVVADHKAAKAARAAAARAGAPTDSSDEPVPPPERFLVSNYTVESLIQVMTRQPKGVVAVCDELTALFGGMNQYKGGKGNDRQFYLSAWSGAPIVVDRKTQEDAAPTIAPSPFLGILGGLTPGMLSEFREGKGREDGLIDRFLFVYPARSVVRWNNRAVARDLVDQWSATIRRLRARALAMDESGRLGPFASHLSPDAFGEWVRWHDRHCSEADALDFPPNLRGSWAKMRAYALRFALVLEYLRWADDLATRDDEPVVVGVDSVRGAIALAEYFKNNCRRVRSLMAGSLDCLSEHAAAILAWARARGVESFTGRECSRGMRARWAHGGMDEAIRELIASGHVLLDAVEPTKTAGRPKAPVYHVNPLSRMEGDQ